jgi:hypothetical protein
MVLKLIFKLLKLNRSKALKVVAKGFHIIFTVLINKNDKIVGSISDFF